MTTQAATTHDAGSAHVPGAGTGTGTDPGTGAGTGAGTATAPVPAHGGSHGRREEDASPVRIVEAALFSAGKPLLVDELAESTGLAKDEVRRALKALQRELGERDTALEVGKAGDKWAMQLKAAYAPHAAKLAPREVPTRTLRTLALIAFHQPILQSDLKRMVGGVVYDHVGELHDRGLVVERQHGISKMLTTSERFPEYFGIPETEPGRIRTYLADKLGVKVGPKPQASLEAAAESAGEAVGPPGADAPVEGAAETVVEEAVVEEPPVAQADAADPAAEEVAAAETGRDALVPGEASAPAAPAEEPSADEAGPPHVDADGKAAAAEAPRAPEGESSSAAQG